MKQLYQTFYNSPVGRITIVACDDALAGLWIDGQKHFAKSIQGQPVIQQENQVTSQVKAWLDSYFRGEGPDPHTLSLRPNGSEFQLVIWQLLTKIPYGQVTTYGRLACEVAAQLGKIKMSAQAVGGAVGRNPISIIVPCHRVVGSTGNLTGYDGGLDKKKYLLRLEGIDPDQPHKQKAKL